MCEGETCLTLQSGREGVSEGRETSQLFTHTTTNQIAPTKHRKHRGNHQQYKGSPRYHLVFQCRHSRRKHGSPTQGLVPYFEILLFFFVSIRNGKRLVLFSYYNATFQLD